MRVDALLDGVAHLFHEERGEVTCPIQGAEAAERPAEILLFLTGWAEVVEARTLGEELAAGDTVHEREIPTLEQGDDPIRESQILVCVVAKVRNRSLGAGWAGSGGEGIAQFTDAGAGDEPQDPCEAGIGLRNVDATAPETARQETGCRIRRVQLDERRGDEQELHDHDPETGCPLMRADLRLPALVLQSLDGVADLSERIAARAA